MIIDFLELTREIITEAFAVLRGERQLQVGLAQILGAARFKELTNGRVYHVKCPKTYRFEKDSFSHMLQCYGLTEAVTKEEDAVPFLVKMARSTALPKGAARIPYMVENYPEEEGVDEETQ